LTLKRYISIYFNVNYFAVQFDVYNRSYFFSKLLVERNKIKNKFNRVKWRDLFVISN